MTVQFSTADLVLAIGVFVVAIVAYAVSWRTNERTVKYLVWGLCALVCGVALTGRAWL